MGFSASASLGTSVYGPGVSGSPFTSGTSVKLCATSFSDLPRKAVSFAKEGVTNTSSNKIRLEDMAQGHKDVSSQAQALLQIGCRKQCVPTSSAMTSGTIGR